MDEQVQNSNTQTVTPPMAEKPLVPPVASPKPPMPPKMAVPSEAPTPKKKGGSGVKILVTLILSGLVFGGGAFAYQQFMVIDPMSDELAMLRTDLETAMMEKASAQENAAMAQKEVDRLSCDGIWDENQGCVEVMIKNEFGEVLLKAAEDKSEFAPIEGYDAGTLSSVFPGLVTEDFLNVETLQGSLIIVDGNSELELTFKPNGEPEHSAAQTISTEGMNTLYQNLLKRYPDSTIEELVATISGEFFDFDGEGGTMEIDGDSDEDEDGLTYDQEILYGSNPKIADTDGDGFSDGDEVSSGYNPNGEGALVIEEVIE